MGKFTTIQAGDQVIRKSGLASSIGVIYTVETVTDQVITLGGSRKEHFSRKTGRNIDYRGAYAPCIVPATPEAVAAIKERDRRNQILQILQRVNFSAQTTDTLEALYAALPQSEINKAQ